MLIRHFVGCQNAAVGRAVVTPDLRSGEDNSLSLSGLLVSPFAILHLGYCWLAGFSCLFFGMLISSDLLIAARPSKSQLQAWPLPGPQNHLWKHLPDSPLEWPVGTSQPACTKQWMLLSDELGLRESKVPITKGLIRRCLFNPGVVTENRST